MDCVIVRELTGGLYFGAKSRRDAAGALTATDTLVYRDFEIERIARFAFELARTRRRHVTSVDKANVLVSSQLWRRIVTDVAREFPDVALAHMLVDNAAMQLVRDPRAFDVIVTENMFGDILSDEAAMITGTIGTAPSASLGAGPHARGFGLYEPISGTAPDIAGRGIANPAAAILSAAMLARFSLGEDDGRTAWSTPSRRPSRAARAPRISPTRAPSRRRRSPPRSRRGSPPRRPPSSLRPPARARSPRTSRTAPDARDRCRAGVLPAALALLAVGRHDDHRRGAVREPCRCRAATRRRAPRANRRPARRTLAKLLGHVHLRVELKIAHAFARGDLRAQLLEQRPRRQRVIVDRRDAREREVEHGLRVAAQAAQANTATPPRP